MASRRLSSESGFTLIEVLLVSSLFLVILTASTLTMTSFERNNRDNQRIQDQSERARRSIERGMRQLRNLASRPITNAATIAVATEDDFVFQTSDPARTWVRYCRESRPDGGTWLWALASSATTAPGGACSGENTSWTKHDPVATSVVNYAQGATNAIFLYGRTCLPTLTATEAAACQTSLGSITSVRMDLHLDDDLTRKPPVTRVSSAVFLRNQNEAPTASYTVNPGSQPRQVFLNASSSTDPEGRTLRYYWLRAAAPPASFSCAAPPTDGSVIGLGVTLSYTFQPAESTTGTTAFTLVVCDPGDLKDHETQQVPNR